MHPPLDGTWIRRHTGSSFIRTQRRLYGILDYRGCSSQMVWQTFSMCVVICISAMRSQICGQNLSPMPQAAHLRSYDLLPCILSIGILHFMSFDVLLVCYFPLNYIVVCRWFQSLVQDGFAPMLPPLVQVWSAKDNTPCMYSPRFWERNLSQWEINACPWWLEYPLNMRPQNEEPLYAREYSCLSSFSLGSLLFLFKFSSNMRMRAILLCLISILVFKQYEDERHEEDIGTLRGPRTNGGKACRDPQESATKRKGENYKRNKIVLNRILKFEI